MIDEFYLSTGEPVEIRSQTLRFLFRNDLMPKTRSAFTEEIIQQAQKVLDLGMEAGAVGSLVKGINPGCILIGNDAVEQFGDTFYHLYDQRIIGDFTHKDVWDEITKLRDINLILGIGLPMEAVDYLIAQAGVLRQMMTRGGICVLAQEIEYREGQTGEFTLYKGGRGMDRTILVLKR